MTKFQSPFPPVELGYDDKKELCRMAKRAVDDTIRDYETFVWTDHGEIRTSRHVVLKSSDDIRVYHDRSAAPNRARDVESLLTVGSVVGTVDDAMYGALSPTTDAMRVKAAYVNELTSLGNGAVLSTIQEPKHEKPFRSITLKWLVRTLPMPARAILKPRDMIVIEATGTMRLSNGERIGFHLVHSVDHLSQLRALPTHVRTSVSTCAIWRQQTADRVHVYVKSFLEFPERLMASVLLRHAAESLVSVWRHVHCAQMKKLMWLLRRQLPSLDEQKKETDKSVVNRCVVCTAKAKTLCIVCAKAVCAKCRVKRELWSLEAGGSGNGDSELVEQNVAFCVPCLSIAIRQSAADVARDEIPDRDVFKDLSSTRSRRVDDGKVRARLTAYRESGSSSTSSERTQDTQDSLSRTSSKPHL